MRRRLWNNNAAIKRRIPATRLPMAHYNRKFLPPVKLWCILMDSVESHPAARMFFRQYQYTQITDNMFQFEWADTTAGTINHLQETSAIARAPPISAACFSCLEEHCLECAPPNCYGKLRLYCQRPDKSCRNLDYGYIPTRLCAARSRWPRNTFSPLGKIETKIFPAALSLRATAAARADS